MPEDKSFRSLESEEARYPERDGTPDAPPSGFQKLFAESGGLKKIGPDGTVADIGGGRVPTMATVYLADGDAVAEDRNGNRISRSSTHHQILMDAMDWVNEQGGGKLHVESGTYYLDQPITPRQGVLMEGEGMQGEKQTETPATNFRPNADIDALIHIPVNNTDPYGYGQTNYEDIVIRDLVLFGDSSYSTDLLWGEDMRDCEVKNIEGRNGKGNGFIIDGPGRIRVRDIRANNVGSAAEGTIPVDIRSSRAHCEHIFVQERRNNGDHPDPFVKNSGSTIYTLLCNAGDNGGATYNGNGTVYSGEVWGNQTGLGYQLDGGTLVDCTARAHGSGINTGGTRATLVSPSVFNLQESGIVVGNGAFMLDPYVGTFSQASPGDHDGISGKGGVVIFGGRIDGGGSGGDGIYMDNNNYTVIGVDEITGINGEPVNYSNSDRESQVAFNLGHQTRDSGVATIASGSTSVTLGPTIDGRYSAQDVSVTPLQGYIASAATDYEIEKSYDADAVLHVDQDPGQDIDFAWEVDVS